MSSPARTSTAPILAGSRSRLSSEEGFTLVELLVAMTMLVGVMTGATMLLTSTMKSQPDLSDRSHQVEQARVAAERMVRELRQGYAVDSANSLGASSVVFRTYLGRTCQGGPSVTPVLCRVTYSCSSTTTICTRTTANPNGTSPSAPRQLIEGVSNSNVFTIQSAYIGVTLVLPTQDGGGSLTVEDGAALRNSALGVM